MLRCLQLVLPWRRGQEKPYTRYLRRQRPSQLRLLIRAKTSQVFRRRPNMLSGNLLGHANDKTRRQHYVLPFSPSNGTRRSSNAVGVAGTTHRDHPNGVGGIYYIANTAIKDQFLGSPIRKKRQVFVSIFRCDGICCASEVPIIKDTVYRSASKAEIILKVHVTVIRKRA